MASLCTCKSCMSLPSYLRVLEAIPHTHTLMTHDHHREGKKKRKHSESEHSSDRSSRHKKKKKRSKKHKSHTRDRAHDQHPSEDIDQAEIDAFKLAVQGHRSVTREACPSRLLYSSADEIAASMGLPKGLIRTSESTSSVTEEYSKKLFGGSNCDNPATRQRLKRERTAQRAMERARNIVAARSTAAKDIPPTGSTVGSILSRFSVGSSGQ